MEHPLRRYRRENGDISLDDFAARVGVSKSQLSRVETGEADPSLSLIRRIAALTDGAVTANDFMHLPAAPPAGDGAGAGEGACLPAPAAGEAA